MPFVPQKKTGKMFANHVLVEQHTTLISAFTEQKLGVFDIKMYSPLYSGERYTSM